MNRLIAVAILLFAASVTRADSIVQVVLEPATFPNVDNMGDETIGASFVWDTTSQVLSDFTVTAIGPITGFSIFGDAEINDSGIKVLDFFNSQGNLFQLDYNIHGGFFGAFPPYLSSTPGIHITDLDLTTQQEGDHFILGTATVSPVGTPEPNSLLLLGVGIAMLGIGILTRISFRDRQSA